MLLISDVTTVELPGNRADWTVDHMPMAMVDEMGEYEKLPCPASHFTREVVEGRRFITRDGKHVIIGATKAVQESIGICFEVYDQQGRTIEQLHETKARLMTELTRLTVDYGARGRKLEKYNGLRWWERLAFVFRGNKYSKLGE